MRKLFLLSLALMVSFGTCAWADAAYGFENNATSESGYPTSAGDGSRSISSSISRTGSYSLEQNNNNTSDKVVKLQNVSATFKGGKHYVHSIAYIRKNTSNNATLKGYSFYAGSEFGNQTASTALSSDWTRVVNKAQRTGNTQNYTSVELRYKTNTATSGDKVYLDDIIVYVTEGNDKTDLKKPESATEPEATAVEISWTNGEDQSDSNNGATGIQNTLIWKRTSGTENDLTLNDQGVYSLTAKEGPSTDQSGHWTLVTASVAAGTAGETSSYSGTFTPGDVYAIVHRDLAYNYSTPTYVTIPAAGDFTVIYKAGAGTGTDVEVQHAVTVADCPNTFSYEGYAFNGWKDSGNNDVAVGSIVSSDMTLTAQWKRVYTITYANGGGSGSAPAAVSPKAQGETFEVAENTFTAPKGKDFDKWNDGTTDYNPGDTYTIGTANVILTAIWKDRPQSSDATLSALSVAGCTLSPAFAPATTAYTVNLPFYASMPAVGDVTATKNDSYAEDPGVSISDNVITVACEAEDGTKLNYTITVNIADAPTASSSINIEQNVLDNTKKWGIESALTAANIVTDGRNGLDSLDESKTLRNYPFLGLKLKKNDVDILKVIVPAGSVLNIKMGSIGAAVNVIVNGEAHSTIAADKNQKDHFFHLDAVAYVREVVFHTTANETTTLQQVKIGTECDPITLPALYTVTYNAGAGTCEKATDFVEFADNQITLPEATPAIGYSFNGWYNAATEGTKVGDAGAKITLSKDSTLYAQYSIIDYAITCSPAENGSVSADKATANYGEEVTLTVTPAEGYKIASVKYNDGEDHVIEAVAGVYSFTMPAAAVTVSATFYYPYVVTYDANGGECATESQAFAGTALTLPVATNSPKYFAGWYDDAEAGNKIGMNGDAYIPTADIILYAHWSDTPTALDNTEDEVKAVKVLENGMLIIEKNGVRYNAMGQIIR